MKICVFCGSSFGTDPIYKSAAEAVGHAFAERDIELVYGGGQVGLMGTVADAVLAGGGRVTGVIPRALHDRELAHHGLTSLVVVESMHERKAAMAERADGFVSLPGGAGTLEEAFEQWTWAQLGIHAKPNGFLNVKGYFEPLRTMIEKCVAEGFVKSQHAAMLKFSDDIGEIIDAFTDYEAPAHKWTGHGEAVKP